MNEHARPLRIAFATDWFLPRLGGIELHLADLARALQGAGHHVDVLTTTPDAASADGLRVVPLAAARAPVLDLALPPSIGRALRAALREGRYDVVHAHVSVVSPVAYTAALTAHELGLPLVVTFHSMLHASAYVLALADRLLGWSRWPLVLSAVSSTVARQARRAAPGLPVAVLPNGIDPSVWDVAPGATRARGGVVHVVSTMRLHRKKRPAALVRAFRAARSRAACDLRLSIFGDGPERRPLERLVSGLGVGDAVTFHGRQPREAIAAHYAAADVFASATRRESFGIAALEARAAGLPVVAMRQSGATEFLRHGENALLAADDESFARMLLSLADDAALRARLAAHHGDVAPYAWPAVVRRHLDRYAEAMRLSGRGAPAAAARA